MTIKEKLKKFNHLKKFFLREEWDILETVLERLQGVMPSRKLDYGLWGYENLEEYNPERANDFLEGLFPWEMHLTYSWRSLSYRLLERQRVYEDRTGA